MAVGFNTLVTLKLCGGGGFRTSLVTTSHREPRGGWISTAATNPILPPSSPLSFKDVSRKFSFSVSVSVGWQPVSRSRWTLRRYRQKDLRCDGLRALTTANNVPGGRAHWPLLWFGVPSARWSAHDILAVVFPHFSVRLSTISITSVDSDRPPLSVNHR